MTLHHQACRWTELLVQAQAGDASSSSLALDELMDEARPALWRYVYSMLGEAAHADDVVSETFIKVWRHLPNYDRTKSNARTWLYRIARQITVDYRRKQGQHLRNEVAGYDILFGSSADEEKVASAEPEDLLALRPEQEADRPGQQQLLEEALQGQRHEDREILRLFHEENLNYEQIAAQLGCSLRAVGPRLTRARNRLRQALHPEVYPLSEVQTTSPVSPPDDSLFPGE